MGATELNENRPHTTAYLCEVINAVRYIAKTSNLNDMDGSCHEYNGQQKGNRLLSRLLKLRETLFDVSKSDDILGVLEYTHNDRL